jgi:hypothetical protein
MKKLLILAVIVLAGCPKHVVPTPPNADHAITLTFNQSFANNSPCSATVTTSCISGFNEGYISGATNIQQHTDTTAICTVSTGACKTTYNATLPIGSLNFFVVTTYLDQNGVAGVTAAATTAAPTQVAADMPTGLTANVQ